VSRARSGHHPKSFEERKTYLQTTIQEQPSLPTVEDTSPIIDATDRSLPSLTREPTSLRRTGEQGLIHRWWQAAGPSTLIGLVVLGILGWASTTLFALNREVGVIGARESRLEDLVMSSKLESGSIAERLDKRIDRLEDRLQSIEQFELTKEPSVLSKGPAVGVRPPG
jgi:hypothetical protein